VTMNKLYIKSMCL